MKKKKLSLEEASEIMFKIIDKTTEMSPLAPFDICDDMIEKMWLTAGIISKTANTSGVDDFSPDEVRLLRLTTFKKLVKVLEDAVDAGMKKQVTKMINEG